MRSLRRNYIRDWYSGLRWRIICKAAQLGAEAGTARLRPAGRAGSLESKSHGVTRRAFARLKCGAPRAAVASARGPWPCSLASDPLGRRGKGGRRAASFFSWPKANLATCHLPAFTHRRMAPSLSPDECRVAHFRAARRFESSLLVHFVLDTQPRCGSTRSSRGCRCCLRTPVESALGLEYVHVA